MRSVADSTQNMVLCAFLASTGYHSASWRRPCADPLVNIKPGYFAALATIAENGGLDAVFLADSMAVWSDVSTRPAGAIEPAVLACAIIEATRQIGVVITQSTSYNEPFNVARRLASLDHLSNGRIGWNIVTSATLEAAQNFGLSEIPDHEWRYRRGEEFVKVCLDLWGSWDPTAVRGDPDTVWADPSLIRPIDHIGEFFKVRGPLDVPPSPQRVPLLVQAGSSERGMELASSFADWVFTVQSDFDSAFRFRMKMQQLTAAKDPSRRIRTLPGLIPVVAPTDAAARRRLADLDALLDPTPGVRQLERSLDLPVGSLSPDDRLDFELPSSADNAGNRTYYQVIESMAKTGSHTVGEAAKLMSTSRGHRLVVGSPDTVASAMIDWVERGAADGYVIMPAVLPEGLIDFVETVVPLLHSAGYLQDRLPGIPLAARYRYA